MPTQFFPHTASLSRRIGTLFLSLQLSVKPRQNRPFLYRLLTTHLYQQFFKWRVGFSLILPALIGCSGYSMHEVRLAIERGEFETALAHLDEENSKKRKLPYLFERGLIAHYANRFEESNQVFERAEIIAEDLYTKRISREIASLLTSDAVRPYPGTRYERLLIHYYRALNYVYLNLPDDALVECRRAGQLLQYYADEDATYNFAGAAFVAYLSGILYEWEKDWNNAYIAYHWAEAGYQRYAEQLGVSLPEDIGHSLARLARFLGFNEDAERYAEFYGEPPLPAPGFGELIFIYESGFVPPKTKENLLFPIFKTDSFVSEEKREEENDEKIWEFADTVVRRRNLRYEKLELEYLVRVEIPVYISNRPRLVGVKLEIEPVSHQSISDRIETPIESQFHQHTSRAGLDEVRVESEQRETFNIELEATDIQAIGVLVEDVEGAALATFASDQKTILLRTVVRAILKYLAFRRAENKGDLLGDLVNFFNVATERADTRSWETLPNQIFLVRMSLPAGTHNVTLSFLDDGGRYVRTETIPCVEIEANGKTFLNHRTFE